jgi:hypothetical protein
VIGLCVSQELETGHQRVRQIMCANLFCSLRQIPSWMCSKSDVERTNKNNQKWFGKRQASFGAFIMGKYNKVPKVHVISGAYIQTNKELQSG